MSTERYEKIKNRMIKKAASVWGVAANEIETSFDPIVSLLIAACASEIINIENDLDESYNRITEKIIQLMTPETVTGSEPAHGILNINAVDDSIFVKPEFQFVYEKKVIQNKTSLKMKSIYFSPIEDFKLINARVKYLIASNTLFEIDEEHTKSVITNSKDEITKPSEVYIGIETPLNTLNLNDVSFYFDNEDIENRELFYYYLQHSKWFVNGEEISTIKGFYKDHENSDKQFLKTVFSENSEKVQTINSKTANFYRRHYLTLKTKKRFDKQSVPSINNSNLSKYIEGEIFWIKVEFTSAISQSLNTINCSLNAFPVLNRNLKSLTYQVKEYINILPIKTEDYFLDVKSIVNTSGKSYIPKSKNVNNLKSGVYSLRESNIGKLDQRSAKEYLFHLIELLKNESAAFSLVNNDFLNNNLKDLNQLISLLSKRIEDSTAEISETNYIMLEPYHEKENILIDYWTTHGEDANNIKSGSRVGVYRAIGVDSNGGQFLTPTQGGRNHLSMNERLNSYRSALLSKGKVVTKEDIKALCYDLLGNKITSVYVGKDFINSYKAKEGIIKCIVIKLEVNQKIKTSDEEWEELKKSLLLMLENKSLNIYPYKISLN